MFDLIPLNQLHPGQLARVGQLLGPAEDVRRLEELGLRGGIQVEMIQPGMPCIIRLGCNKLCFRSGEALHVLVEPGVRV